MAEIDQIIEITITRETTAPSTASFNIPVFISTFTNFSERARVYTDFDGLKTDFPSGNVYTWGSKVFGQEGVRPPSVVIGRRQVDSVNGSIGTVANSTVYSLKINNTLFSITSSGSATAINIVSALKAAYDAGPISGITFTNNGDGTFVIGVTASGTGWSIIPSDNVNLVNVTPTETWPQALAAVQVVANNWYALNADTHAKTDILAIAEAIQPQHKIYITSTSDNDVPSSASTDVATALSEGGYTRTCLVYSTQASSYPEAVWLGSQLPRTVGSNDWDFKQGAGLTPDNLTDTQRVNLRAKNANMFTTVAGVNVFQDGNMADGKPIDEIIITDWTYSRLQEAIYFVLINSLKIPFTRAGFTIIENRIRSVLAQGVANGAYASYTVTSPDPLLISPTQRANRIAGDFKFTAVLAGSVRKVVIKGTLTV